MHSVLREKKGNYIQDRKFEFVKFRDVLCKKKTHVCLQSACKLINFVIRKKLVSNHYQTRAFK